MPGKKQWMRWPDGLRYSVPMKYRVCLVMAVLAVMVWAGGCATVRPPRGVPGVTRTMEVTGYCKCKKCCGWRRTWYGKSVVKGTKTHKKVGVTASGVKAKPGRTIAADTSRYPFGTIMYVPGYGYGRVEDRGSAMAGDKIDLFFGSHKEALKWGRQKKSVQVWVVSGK